MNELLKLGLWLMFGMALGSAGVTYIYESRPKPAQVVELVSRVEQHETDLALLKAKVDAEELRAEQRLKEIRFSLDKLERLKLKQDAALKEVSITQLAKGLGMEEAVGK